MEIITIKGLDIFAYHGVNPEEKRDGQRFVLDLFLEADLRLARRSDLLQDTVNYAAVRKTVQRVFTAQSFDLIERAAQAVCDGVLLENERVSAVTVRLKKPEAPMNATFDYVAVEIRQERAASEAVQGC